MECGTADCQRRNIACVIRPRHNDAMTPDIMTSDIADEPSGDPTYAFKASLIGSMCRFTLKPDALEWQVGRRSGRFRYKAVGAVRLSYRPVTTQAHRFITEIWSPGNPKIQIVSVSWRSVMEQQRLDAAYAAFIVELHRRLAAAGARAEFSTGLPFATYWVGVVVFGAVLIATGGLLVRAASFDQWAPMVVVAIFFLVFAYQLGTYFYRNRPGRYRPDAVPAAVLPKV
jgi:hypothetical protein